MHEGIKALKRTPAFSVSSDPPRLLSRRIWERLVGVVQLADFLEPKLLVRLPGFLFLGACQLPEILSLKKSY
jgi:hypothetical protein